jgi:23S rRNA pseudouridine1911/1915/1917 synthase
MSSARDAERERRDFQVGPEEAGERLDRYLAERLPELSRTRVQELIAEGRVRVAGVVPKRAHRVAPGETIAVELVPRPPLEVVPEELPLEILYEDDDVLAVNKPAGMVVHPAAGARHGTLVNALVARFGQLSRLGGALRPGIVHRLDKGTSGVLIVARTDSAHAALARQFRERRIEKTYLALVHGEMKADAGRVTLPVARDLRRRTRMTARRREGRAAETAWRLLARLDGYSLLEVGLRTGRTHQIRVHLAAVGHPVVGDPAYGAPREPRAAGQRLRAPARPFLHAARIRFAHPRTGEPVETRAPLPQDLRDFLGELAHALGVGQERVDAALRPFL